jgi:transposase InsO family protein
VQHESSRRLLRQCGDGELLRDREERGSGSVSDYGDAKMALFDYIEVFYNQRRRHSTLDQVSPARFEREAAA